MKNRKNNKKDLKIGENVFDRVNKYGTYEIQPTADTENLFPAIAQGLNSGAKNQKNKGSAKN